MKLIGILAFALLGYWGAINLAQAADSCAKDCRNFQQACLKAHSNAACKADYDICMKHCRKN